MERQTDARIQTYETDALKSRIAHEVGLPFEMSSRLNGSTEADIRKDAQSLLKLLKPKNPRAPSRGDPDPSGGSKRDALRTFTNQLMQILLVMKLRQGLLLECLRISDMQRSHAEAPQLWRLQASQLQAMGQFQTTLTSTMKAPMSRWSPYPLP